MIGPRLPDYLEHILGAIGRNVVAHGYFAVDLDIVWRTVWEDLPKLASLIKALPAGE